MTFIETVICRLFVFISFLYVSWFIFFFVRFVCICASFRQTWQKNWSHKSVYDVTVWNKRKYCVVFDDERTKCIEQYASSVCTAAAGWWSESCCSIAIDVNGEMKKDEHEHRIYAVYLWLFRSAIINKRVFFSIAKKNHTHTSKYS